MGITCTALAYCGKWMKWVINHVSTHLHNMSICTLLPRNQSFYRQITSQEKDGAVSGVGQW